MEISGELQPGWQMIAGYSYRQLKDGDGRRVDTWQPNSLFRLWTTYRLPGAWHPLTVGGGVNWQISTSSEVSAGGGTVTAKQKAYAIYNLMARYDFNSRLSAQLNLNKLFDKKYYLGGVANQVYYGEPRSVFVNLTAKF
ncbi:hypothetical protein G6F57_016210 [Rhizopus arrhizus]|nr:hypothetical protein G6F57_016210 [Rhizopus arrhizus]